MRFKTKVVLVLVLALFLGIGLFWTLPKDNPFHIQGVLAALLCIGSIVSLLIVAVHSKVVKEEMERRKNGKFHCLLG